MNLEEVRQYCLAKKGVTEELPFDDYTLVYKVMGKMFALTNSIGNFSINLKCDPQLAIELRERFPSVTPGYHMNKQHWNTVLIDGNISSALLCEWIDHSYNLVVRTLSKKLQTTLNQT